MTSVAAASRVALATGSLLPGSGQSSVGTTPQSPSFNAFASANLSFVPTAAAGSFFLDPSPFYNVAGLVVHQQPVSGVAAQRRVRRRLPHHPGRRLGQLHLADSRAGDLRALPGRSRGGRLDGASAARLT